LGILARHITGGGSFAWNDAGSSLFPASLGFSGVFSFLIFRATYALHIDGNTRPFRAKFASCRKFLLKKSNPADAGSGFTFDSGGGITRGTFRPAKLTFRSLN
jgi:hypothetical protein